MSSKKRNHGFTPKALMHAKEDEFQHKAIIIAEYEGVAESRLRDSHYAIRAGDRVALR